VIDLQKTLELHKKWLLDEDGFRAESEKYAEHMDAGDLFEASRVAGRIEAFDEVRCMTCRVGDPRLSRRGGRVIRWECRACIPPEMDIAPCELSINADMRPLNKPVLCHFNLFRSAKWELVEDSDCDTSYGPAAVPA